MSQEGNWTVSLNIEADRAVRVGSSPVQLKPRSRYGSASRAYRERNAVPAIFPDSDLMQDAHESPASPDAVYDLTETGTDRGYEPSAPWSADHRDFIGGSRGGNDPVNSEIDFTALLDAFCTEIVAPKPLKREYGSRRKKPVPQTEEKVSDLSSSALVTLEEQHRLGRSENVRPLVANFNIQNESESERESERESESESESESERNGNMPAEEYTAAPATAPATAPALSPQRSSYAYAPDSQMQHVHGIQYRTVERHIENGMHAHAQQTQYSPDSTCVFVPSNMYMTQSLVSPVFHAPHTSVPIMAYPSFSYPFFSMQPQQIIAPPSPVGSFMNDQQHNYFEQHPPAASTAASTIKKVPHRTKGKKATNLECYSSRPGGSTRETVEDSDFIIDVEGLERLHSTEMATSVIGAPINTQESQAVEMRTTLMIKNIPNKYSKDMLLAEIEQSHSGTYDFFYLPIDQKKLCNTGYAFINFKHPKYIPSFMRTFHGKRWTKFASDKVCNCIYSRAQGHKTIVEKFKNSLLACKDPAFQPLVLHASGPLKGNPMILPAAT